MNKPTKSATRDNTIITLDSEKHSTWFWQSGVFLFSLWLVGSFMLSANPAQARPVDTTPPTVPGTPSAGGAYTKVCYLNWTWGASYDSGSGLAGYQYILYKDSSYLSSGNTTATSYANGCFGSGVYALYVRAYDNVGNYSAYASGSIIIDTVAPTCSVTASGPTLTATCSDTGGSGCTQSTQTQTAATTGTYTFTFSDNAGNSGSCSYAYTAPRTDTTPPTGSVDPAAGTNYSTYSYNVTASYTDASGVASITYCTVNGTSSCSPYITSAASSVVVTINSPIVTFCRFGTDTLGNSSGVTCGTYYLRPTQPNTINLFANYNDGSVTIDWWDTATSESSFRITRTGPSNTTFSAPAKSGTGSTSYTDISCPVGGTYTYAVAACNAAGCSAAISDSVGKPGCDTTPPRGTVSFNPSVNYTSASSSRVDLGCSDAGGSGCSTYELYGVDNSSCGGSLITSGSYSGPVSTTINLGGQGPKAISAKFTDAAGNSSCVSQKIYVDTTPPSGSVSINGRAATTSSTNVTLTLTCIDDTDPTIALAPLSNKFVFVSEILHWLGLNWIAKAALPGPNGGGGCQSYYVYTNNNCSGSAVGNGTALPGGQPVTTSATLSSGSGTKYISVQYMDGAGNTFCAADSIELVTLPTACTSVGVTSVVSGSGVTNVTPVTFQCYGSSGGAVNEYLHTYYLNSSYQSTVTTYSYLDLTLGQGTYTDCIQAHNSAGYSSSTCGSMVVDTAAPTCGTWSPASSTPHASGGTTFTLSGSTDAGSGIATAGGTCTTGSANGNTCNVIISDNAGNTRACTSPPNNILSDTTPPSVYATPNVVANAAGWNNSNVVVSLFATDADSGIKDARYAWGSNPFNASCTSGGSLYYQSGSRTLWAFTLSSSNTLYLCGFDNAGNVSTASYNYKIDTAPPTVSATLAESQGTLSGRNYTQTATSTTANDPQFIVTVVDSGSGMSTGVNPTCELRNVADSKVGSCSCNGAICTGKIVGGNVNGTYTIKNFFDIKDNAGNPFNGSVSFSVDNKPPTILRVQ